MNEEEGEEEAEEEKEEEKQGGKGGGREQVSIGESGTNVEEVEG